MHDVVRRNCMGCGPGLQLMRYPTDDGLMIFAFRRGRVHPVWVAKKGAGRRGRLRMQGEKRALAWILPWHRPLRTPELLDSMETAAEIWVVQSGLHGEHRSVSIGASGVLPAELSTAAEWLYQFQRLVATPAETDLQEIAFTWARNAEARPDGWSDLLWKQVRAASRPVPAVAVHGDFWPGNLLFERDRMSVLDWNNFHAGNPLDDLLTLLMTTLHTERGRYLDRMSCFLRTFFAPDPTLELLRAWALRSQIEPLEGRFCFYLFLARRLRWELGFGLQSRSSKSIAQSQTFWKPALAWLAAHNFPDPFHSVLPPIALPAVSRGNTMQSERFAVTPPLI